MTDVPVVRGRPAERVVSAAVATTAAYAVLGAALVVTRLGFLGHSFWHDEIYTVANIVRPGPARIFAGAELNHELYDILAWAGQFVLGRSEASYRVWSAVPFVLGVGAVTAWLHVRVRALAGILFLFLATVSPLLLDITREARGYGLAFAAMAAMTIASLEEHRNGGMRTTAVFCIAGVLGTWTLPQFGIAFLATGAVLLLDRSAWRRVGIGLALSGVAIVIWYAPHLTQLQVVAQSSGRHQIHGAWIMTAPIDQVVLPALIWIDGVALVPGIVWLPIVLVVAALMASGELARDRRVAVLLTTGTLATIATLWIAQTFVVPRYLSYLLVPLFMLLASGVADVLAAVRSQRGMALRAVAALVGIAVLALHFAALAPDVVLLPRVAHRNAAEVILRELPTDAPVYAYMHNPSSLAFYLGRQPHALHRPTVAERVCTNRRRVAYVMQPFDIRPVDVPCLNRAGTVHFAFRQYARGGVMNVWIVPPARTS